MRSDVAVQIFGDDLDELKRLGDEVARVVGQVKGAADVKAEQVAGLPYLRIKIDRQAIARYGINVSQVLDVVRAVGGRIVGQILEGQRRFFFQVRFQEEDRSNLERISNLKIADSRGRLIPLSQLAALTTEEGPAQISRENIHRRLAVEANIRGRDLGSFISDAQRAVEDQVVLPPGYWIEWGGQFENLQRASRRLAIVVPMALFLIFVLLYTTFKSARLAALIYINVPVAATGRNPGAVPTRDALQHLGRCGFHRPVRRGGPQRGGAGLLPQPTTQGGRLGDRGSLSGCPGPDAPGSHDSSGGQPGLRPHGPVHKCGS